MTVWQYENMELVERESEASENMASISRSRLRSVQVARKPV